MPRWTALRDRWPRHPPDGPGKCSADEQHLSTCTCRVSRDTWPGRGCTWAVGGTSLHVRKGNEGGSWHTREKLHRALVVHLPLPSPMDSSLRFPQEAQRSFTPGTLRGLPSLQPGTRAASLPHLVLRLPASQILQLARVPTFYPISYLISLLAKLYAHMFY